MFATLYTFQRWPIFYDIFNDFTDYNSSFLSKEKHVSLNVMTLHVNLSASNVRISRIYSLCYITVTH